MLNILSNALRHARDKVTVIVEGSEISIEDDGPGFKPEQREKIFDPFYHGDKGGSGLGLAISRAIVEKHGGKIRADNRTMGGGKIRISFND
jgi:signal transduction histidine kinase